MATDATGTPTTNYSIPKFNTSVDAPSGLGGNAQMDFIDNLLKTGFTGKPAGIVSGEVPVWNGTTWVRSSATNIGPGSLGSGTPSPSNFLRGDGTWAVPPVTGPTITTSTWAGGPPGSPNDKDIWIATAVDAIGTRWQFQYNAGSGSANKWEFIGGTPIRATAGTVTAALSAWTTAVSWTAGRAGDYEVTASWLVGQNNAATAQAVLLGVSANGAAPGSWASNQFPADTLSHDVVTDGTCSPTAGQTVTLMVDPQTLQLNVQASAMRIVPRRII